MRKKEELLYKDGIKNIEGYKFSILKPKEKIIIILSIFLLAFFSIFLILDNYNVISINNIASDSGIIDGVDKQASDFAIYFLDVGQSDCAIVICNNEVLMIDTGTANQLNVIRQSLKSLDISTIDYLIITHPHDDHMGSAYKLINEYNIENILMTDFSDNSDLSYMHSQLLKCINRNNVNKIEAKPGLTFKIGDAFVCIYSPINIDKDLNNNSIIVKIVYGETSYLFQGDAEASVEKELIKSQFNLDSDILKLGHHGSNTSSTTDFLNKVTPFAGIISCGSDNTYCHPDGSIIDRLDNMGIDAYATSLSGDITITSNGQNICIITENGKKAIYNK